MDSGMVCGRAAVGLPGREAAAVIQSHWQRLQTDIGIGAAANIGQSSKLGRLKDKSAEGFFSVHKFV